MIFLVKNRLKIVTFRTNAVTFDQSMLETTVITSHFLAWNLLLKISLFSLILLDKSLEAVQRLCHSSHDIHLLKEVGLDSVGPLFQLIELLNMFNAFLLLTFKLIVHQLLRHFQLFKLLLECHNSTIDDDVLSAFTLIFFIGDIVTDFSLFLMAISDLSGQLIIQSLYLLL